MKVLVAYATAHGSTHQVADAIGRRLGAAGFDVTVRAAGDVADAASFDAVVLGSALHNGRWLTPAADLAAELRRLPARPLWMFSVCTVGDTSSFLGPRVSQRARRNRPLPAAVEASGAPHRFFAGVIAKDHWNFLGRWFFVLARGRYGDRRDWSDIEAWSEMIAAALTARTVPEPTG